MRRRGLLKQFDLTRTTLEAIETEISFLASRVDYIEDYQPREAETENTMNPLKLELNLKQSELDMLKCLKFVALGERDRFRSRNPKMTSKQMRALLDTAAGAMAYTLEIACNKDGDITANDIALSIAADFQELLDSEEWIA
jgi:hypothetical protein